MTSLILPDAVLAVVVLPGEDLQTGGHHDGPELLLDDLVLLLVVDGVGRADPLADLALARLEVAAVVHLDGRPLGHRLREGDVDGLGGLEA